MSAARPWRRRALLMLVATVQWALVACGSDGRDGAAGDAADNARDNGADEYEELPAGAVWPGMITRTLVLNRQQGDRSMTVWREERWENFRVTGSSTRTSASFDTDWSLTERIRETTGDCVYRREASGTASYPWLMFETDPFNELEYRIQSAGTGDTDEVEGTMHGHCLHTTPPEFTAPYQTAPSWLMALPFDLPPEYQVPGYAPPDASQFGPVIAGRMDPSMPDLIRGRWQGRVPGDDAVVTLTWTLNRSGECDEQDARELVRQQRQVVERALQAGDVEANGAGRQTIHLVALGGASSYSVASVTGALQATLGSDFITITPTAGASDGSGLVRFAVRLSRDGRILQSVESIQRTIDSACVPHGSFEGARTILAGAVQWTGDDYRVSMRKFDVETAAVRDAVREDGRGGVDRLNASLQNMMLNFAAEW